MPALSPIIKVMSDAVIKASKGLLRDFNEVDNLQVSRKGTANFVTAADLRAEKVLRQELSKARPGYGFLMEEGGEVKGKDDEFRWIIDPLDGTTNFIHALPYFAITVALERKFKTKSEIVAGVIYDPIHNELFWAEKHKGAYMNNRRISVSARKDTAEALLSTGTPRLGKEYYTRSLRMLRAITGHSIGVRSCGSAALDLAYVAAGRYDGYWHTTLKPWDMAAGVLLVSEAGGQVSGIHGEEHNMDSGHIVATNKALHAKIIRLLCWR